jgi:Legionella pneumophila major outer membrane protein precursor
MKNTRNNEMAIGFVVTLGSIATAQASYAQDAPSVESVASPIADQSIAQPTTSLSTVKTATATLDQQPSFESSIAPKPEFAPPIPVASKPEKFVVEPVVEPVAQTIVAKPTRIQIQDPDLMQKFDVANTMPIVNAQAQPRDDRSSSPLPDEFKALQDKQLKLEQEIEQLKQLVKEQSKQSQSKPEIKPHEDLPSGLQIYSEAVFLKPRSDLMMDYARVDPGSTFLATGGPIAALDYRESTAWRVNARYRFTKSPWEVGASYTRLGSDDASSATKPAGGFLFSTLTAPRGGSASADNAIATAKIDSTVIDVDAGYHIQPSRNVDFKLIAGLRIANIGQNMSAVYSGGSFDPIPGTFVASQQFRGLGPRVGGEARVALGAGFSVYGRGSGSLLFGDQESDVMETAQGVPVADFKVKRKQTVPVIDAAIGLDWSTKLGQNGKLLAGVGYEYQQWFNLTRNVRYTDASAPGGFVENRGDLSMQGFFAKLGLSWTF